MAKSFWPFLVQNQQDVAAVNTLVDRHNRRFDVGETLQSEYMVRYQGYWFWLFCNGGGERLTTAFLDTYVTRNNPDMMLFWPFANPQGWFDVPDSDVFYEKYLAILANLPATLDNNTISHPFLRSSPPACTPRDAILEQFNAGGIKVQVGVRIGDMPNKAPCYTCGQITSNACSACKLAFTCSTECQRADWYLHKVNCPKLRAETSA